MKLPVKFLSITIGVISVAAAYFLDPYRNAGDFVQALYPAHDYLSSTPPLTRFIASYVPSPLTITPLGLPLAFLPEPLAGALWFGISSVLLAWSIRKRSYLYLLFVSWPFVQCLTTRQYAPLLMALALSDLAIIGLLIKPHIALPLALTHRSHPIAYGVVIGVGAWSLFAFGFDWPLRWLSQIGGYTGRPPLLYPIGLLVFIVALLSRRWLIALYCLVPIRAAYDLLPLFLAAASWPEALIFALASWLLRAVT